jgi:hypothetical protein
MVANMRAERCGALEHNVAIMGLRSRMYVLMIAAAFQAAFSPMNAEQGGWCCDLGVQGMAHGKEGEKWR